MGNTLGLQTFGHHYHHRSSIEYQLSDQHFVEQGWTVLPIAKTMRKIIQYEARPAKPHLNWFEKHKNDGRIYYNNGSAVFANFHTDGSGEVFYPNGKLAIEVRRPENRKYDMCTVFTPGGKDCVGVERKSQIVAVFDTMGNGAVFDEDGATRLSYNQIGGIWRDNPAGSPLTWMWDSKKESIVKIVYAEKPAAHLEKLLSPALRTTTKRSVKASTSSPSSRNKEKKVVEQEPVIAAYDEEEVESGCVTARVAKWVNERCMLGNLSSKISCVNCVEQKLPDRKDNFYDHPKETCCLKAICTKLTDCVSLKILNRRNINLQFLANAKRIRLELGTVLNLNKEVASYFVDSSSKDAITKCKFDQMLSFQLETHNSLHNLVQELRKVKQSARQRKHMIAKYMPNFSAWQKIKTRCRP
ncbi:uncharacterized protein LOC143147220 [Ptiloglossa arizonensis]|uniref:uncharacterized protein LOC143147220 n=1 Tax=Ptiloglossa arizonensis TaxID=3350558 RepID=UPI003F9EF11B